jgi:hypothetical protein
LDQYSNDEISSAALQIVYADKNQWGHFYAFSASTNDCDSFERYLNGLERAYRTAGYPKRFEKQLLHWVNYYRRDITDTRKDWKKTPTGWKTRDEVIDGVLQCVGGRKTP